MVFDDILELEFVEEMRPFPRESTTAETAAPYLADNGLESGALDPEGRLPKGSSFAVMDILGSVEAVGIIQKIKKERRDEEEEVDDDEEEVDDRGEDGVIS